MSITGANTYQKYGWETAFKTASTSINKIFGVGQKINRSETRNLKKEFTTGQRNAQVIVPLAFEGSCTMDFKLSNPWFLRGVFGNAPNHDTGTPDIWYFIDSSNNSGDGALDISNNIPSFTILDGINLTQDMSANASPDDYLLGCVIDTTNITFNQGEVVGVSLDIKYADVSHNIVTYAAPAVVADTYDPFTFANGTIGFGGDQSGNGRTTIALIQSGELTIKNTMDLLPAVGSPVAAAKVTKQFEVDGKITALFSLTRDLLNKFYGTYGTTETFTSVGGVTNSEMNGPRSFTLSVLFDNGLTLDNQRAIQFEFSGFKISDQVLNQSVEEPVVHELTLMGLKPTYVIAKNASTTVDT